MNGASQTAIGVGILRAMHRLVDAQPWVIDDPLSLALFGTQARRQLADAPDRPNDPRAAALRGHVLVRSAFAETRLRLAVARGVRQYVALGAGFDTFAYRQPDWMDGVRVFEVDAPSTQTEKRMQLARAAIDVPNNVVFTPIDFERTPLDAGLRQTGFDSNAPAFFSWLGVMMYLTRDAIDAVFRYVAALPAESEITFTFTPRGGSDELAQRLAAVGEPLRTRIDCDEIEPMLRAIGFRDAWCLGIDEGRRFLGNRHDALRLPDHESIATAIA